MIKVHSSQGFVEFRINLTPKMLYCIQYKTFMNKIIGCTPNIKIKFYSILSMTLNSNNIYQSIFNCQRNFKTRKNDNKTQHPLS